MLTEITTGLRHDAPAKCFASVHMQNDGFISVVIGEHRNCPYLLENVVDFHATEIMREVSELEDVDPAYIRWYLTHWTYELQAIAMPHVDDPQVRLPFKGKVDRSRTLQHMPFFRMPLQTRHIEGKYPCALQTDKKQWKYASQTDTKRLLELVRADFSEWSRSTYQARINNRVTAMAEA